MSCSSPRLQVANFVTITSEEVARLGLSNTFVEEEELAAARAKHAEAVIATVSDAMLFNELDPLLEVVRDEDAPQITQDAQEQAPEAEEVPEAPGAAEGPKPGRRGR